MSVDVGDRVIVTGGNDARKAPAVVIDVNDDGEGTPAAIVIYERDDQLWADLDDRMRRQTAEVLTHRDEYIRAAPTYVYPADQLRRVLWIWEPSEGPAANGGAGT